MRGRLSRLWRSLPPEEKMGETSNHDTGTVYFSPLGHGLSFLRGWRSCSLSVYSGRPRRCLWTAQRTLNLLSFFLSASYIILQWIHRVDRFLIAVTAN